MPSKTSVLLFSTPLIFAASAFCQCDVDVEWVQAEADNSWSTTSGPPVVVFQEKMWMLGGGNIWSSTDGFQWTEEVEMAEWGPRGGYGTAVHQHKLWVMGGIGSESEEFNNVWCSSDGIEWTQVTESAAWSPRFNLTSLGFNEKLWAICGVTFDTTATAQPTDVWSSEDGVLWEETTSAVNENIIALQGHSSVAFDSKMWILGGQDYTSTVRSEKVYSSTDGVEWKLMDKVGDYWAVASFPALVFDDKIWVLGGFQGGIAANLQNSAWHSPDGITWTESNPESNWSERYDHGAVVFNDRIWVIGGEFLDNVWYSQPHYKRSDMNRDGCVDDVDLFLFQQEWHENSD